MNAYFFGVATGVVGLLLGMWVVRHPDDTRTYAQAAVDRLKRLFHRS